MIVRIDRMSEEPIYRQIRSQVIKAIATGELEEGDQLPSVRALASDLGINFHTVHEAYAVLRDEGYLVMRGRSGAIVADRTLGAVQRRAADEDARMSEGLLRLALAHKARGGSREGFLDEAVRQVDVAYATDKVDSKRLRDAGEGR